MTVSPQIHRKALPNKHLTLTPPSVKMALFGKKTFFSESQKVNKLQLPDRKSYLPLIELAKNEDLGLGDITSEITIPADKPGAGRIIFRQTGVLCGLAVARDVLHCYDENLQLETTHSDSQTITVGESVAHISGSLRSLLAAERIMLNFLQRLSGIATLTQKYVEAVKGSSAQICDTRKTTPGWRELEKYAVRCGGGHNHRSGLYDAVLIKDNHLQSLGPGNLQEKLEQVIKKTRQIPQKPQFVEVEVDNFEQLAEVLKTQGVDMILLDNMAPEQLTQAVQMRNQLFPDKRVLLEASGGITLENVGQVAAAGVERISIGALTHSVPSLDISFDVNG
jgi:nicotinate-nucleotide pyrophosphorylase (carboxylating)